MAKKRKAVESLDESRKDDSPPDRFVITALGVGHGDAILLEHFEWSEENQCSERIWTCLVDGGESPELLRKRLDVHEPLVTRIDLLVLSHIDNDHIGGLFGLLDGDISIDEYWCPALWAFKRHLWAFGERCKDSIQRAEEFERRLRDEKIATCIYPLEGFTSSPKNASLKLRVIFPPARLIRRLLVADDVGDLLSQQPTPLGQFLGDDVDDNEDLDAQTRDLDLEMLTGNALTPDSIPERLRRTIVPLIESEAGSVPEFFGDSLLNNTSITVYIEYKPFEGQRYTLLLPGDLENWTYLLGKHPLGLRADILKASHHGGRVYIEGNPTAEDSVFAEIQPRAVIFSATGRHKLPRDSIRSAAINRGAAVFCTSCRTKEVVLGLSSKEHSTSKETSCHTLYDCSPHTSSNGETTSDREIQLSNLGITSTSVACHSGFPRHIGPVIHVEQHIISPSNLTNQLLDRELSKHIKWVQDQLADTHQADSDNTSPDQSPEPVLYAEILDKAIIAKRHSLRFNLSTVLKEGAIRRKLWATATRHKHLLAADAKETEWKAYSLPNDKEQTLLAQWITNRKCFLFAYESDARFRDYDSLLFCLARRSAGLESLVSGALSFPQMMFHDELWPIFATHFKREWCAYELFSLDEEHKYCVLTKSRTTSEVAQHLLSEWERVERGDDHLFKAEMGLPLDIECVLCTREDSIRIDAKEIKEMGLLSSARMYSESKKLFDEAMLQSVQNEKQGYDVQIAERSGTFEEMCKKWGLDDESGKLVDGFYASLASTERRASGEGLSIIQMRFLEVLSKASPNVFESSDSESEQSEARFVTDWYVGNIRLKPDFVSDSRFLFELNSLRGRLSQCLKAATSWGSIDTYSFLREYKLESLATKVLSHDIEVLFKT